MNRATATVLLVTLAVLLAGCRTTSDRHTTIDAESIRTRDKRANFHHSTRTIGHSVANAPIIAHTFIAPSARETVLIFAAIHGDEPTTAIVAQRLIEHLHSLSPSDAPSVIIVPVANPDGLARKRRSNLHGVDLNRNFDASNWRPTARSVAWTGPKPLSEPESRALSALVTQLRPVRILSIHSIRRGRHGVNYDGPAEQLAQMMARENGYPVLATMGYSTPGSFGSFAGIDLKIPTITLELPADQPGDDAWRDNQRAILAFLRGE